MIQQARSQDNQDVQGTIPGTYLLSFACQGAGLAGATGRVNRRFSALVAARTQQNLAHLAPQQARLTQPCCDSGATSRSITLRAIREVCGRKAWNLLAANVRRDHVHVVVQAEAPPERVISTLKLYTISALNEDCRDRRADPGQSAGPDCARYIWTRDQLSAAILGVVSGLVSH